MSTADRHIYGLSTHTVLERQLLAPGASTIVAYQRHPVRLDAVAHVRRGRERQVGELGTRPARRVPLFRSSRAPTSWPSRRDQAVATDIPAQLPPSAGSSSADRSVAIRESVADVKFTLLLTIASSCSSSSCS
jgi:hypothetical protein